MKHPPHTRQYYLVRWHPHQLYTLEKIAPTGAECVPVMGHHAARAKQRELNDKIRAERNLPPHPGFKRGQRPPHPGFKRGQRPPGRKPKLADPTTPVTLQIPQSVLGQYPADVRERNKQMLTAIINAKKSENEQ